MGYVGYGGFWRAIEFDLFTFGKIIDRNAAVYKGDVNNNGACDYEDIEWRNAGTYSGTATLVRVLHVYVIEMLRPQAFQSLSSPFPPYQLVVGVLRDGP